MKKIIILFLLFLIYTIAICFCPFVTQWDKSIILAFQDFFKDLPLSIPLLLDSQLYAIFIILPLITGIVYFSKKLLLIDIILFASCPLVAYIFNIIFKNIIQRPRPDIDLQLVVHPHSFSYVSNHTLVTSALWGLVIFYLVKYCSNKILKTIGIVFSVNWIIFVGITRVWLGVHNFTDVLGGYFLAAIIICIYIELIKLIGGKVQDETSSGSFKL